MRNRCQVCNGWNDPLEWPDAERENYDPNLCYACARQARIVSDDQKESTDDTTITPEEDAAELDALDAEAEGGCDDTEA